MKKSFYILFFIVLTGCSRSAETAPEGTLNEKEMISVLTDLHFAQSAINEKTGKEKTDLTNDLSLELVLKKHNITRSVFLKSMKFYSENPDVLNELYDSVIVRLNTPKEN